MTKKIPELCNQKGFTLLELMIATVVLAIGLLGIAGLQLTAITGNASSSKFTVANGVISDQIEDFKRMAKEDGGYDKIVSKNDFIIFVDDQPYENDNAPTDGFYMTRVTTVADDSPITDTKTVTVRVSWVDKEKQGDDQTRELQFQTVIAKPAA